MSTHTPGPWRIGDYPFDVVRATSADEYRVIATVNHEKPPRALPECEANVQLIAAAPELLDDAQQNDNAFTWLAEQMNSLTDNAKHWNVAQIEAVAQDLRLGIERNQKRTRAAIAKAQGRSA